MYYRYQELMNGESMKEHPTTIVHVNSGCLIVCLYSLRWPVTVPPSQTLSSLPEDIHTCMDSSLFVRWALIRNVLSHVKRRFARYVWVGPRVWCHCYEILNTNVAVRKQSCLNRCWLFLCQFRVEVYHFWSCWMLTALVWTSWQGSVKSLHWY